MYILRSNERPKTDEDYQRPWMGGVGAFVIVIFRGWKVSWFLNPQPGVSCTYLLYIPQRTVFPIVTRFSRSRNLTHADCVWCRWLTWTLPSSRPMCFILPGLLGCPSRVPYSRQLTDPLHRRISYHHLSTLSAYSMIDERLVIFSSLKVYVHNKRPSAPVHVLMKETVGLYLLWKSNRAAWTVFCINCSE